MIQIEKNEFTTFLNKVQMSGSQVIQECVLQFTKDGLKINANSPSQHSRVIGWLKVSAFNEYEEIGNIGVNDLGTIIKVFDRFGDKISLTKQGNLLTVKSPGKTVDIELISENFLKTDTTDPKLEFETTFKIDITQLKNIFKDVTLNKDSKLLLETEDKKVLFRNTGKYKFINEVAAVTVKAGIKVTYGQPFIDVTTNLDSDLELSLRSNYPGKIMEVTDNSIITIIVAPIIEEE